LRWSIRSSANDTVCDSTNAVGSEATVLPAEATTPVAVPMFRVAGAHPPRTIAAIAKAVRTGRIGDATRLGMRRRRWSGPRRGDAPRTGH